MALGSLTSSAFIATLSRRWRGCAAEIPPKLLGSGTFLWTGTCHAICGGNNHCPQGPASLNYVLNAPRGHQDIPHEAPPRHLRRQGQNFMKAPSPAPSSINISSDDATAGNERCQEGHHRGQGRPEQLCISEYLMTQLQGIERAHPFRAPPSNMREQLIKEVEIIPLEVVVRNVAAGSMSKRLGIEEGTPLPRSIIEYYYKNDGLQDPWVSEEHITAFGWASPQDLDDIVNLTIRVNDFLSGLFLGAGIKLVDFKLEFGRLWENDYMRIVLADEISPDNCRLWDTPPPTKSSDKDYRFPLSRYGRGGGSP